MYDRNGEFKDVGNIAKGCILESAVKNIYRKEGYTVTSHSIFMNGYDVEAKKGSDIHIIECLNWYGGYVHRNRFLSIITNLAKSATSKFLVCCGVSPTREQYRILNAMKVKVIHYKDQLFNVTNDVLHFLRSKLLGVITDSGYRFRRLCFGTTFYCDSVVTSIFDWFRQKFKLWLDRFCYSFHGFVRCKY